MIHVRTAILGGVLFAAVFGLSACNKAQVNGHTVALTAQLAGASEVPPTNSSGTGSLEATLDKQTNMLSWSVKYSGLSGPATAAHFHGPAIAGESAGVALPIAGKLDSPIKGEATLTPEQTADLLAGKWYVNVHTAADPNGEIRGQVVVQH
jgi:hypothetical protein